MESKIEKKYIWHRIKRGQTLSRIAKRNGIEDWKELYDFNKDLLKNPNLLIYIDEKDYDDGWCINNKQGILRIPIVDRLNSQAQPEESNFVHTVGTPILESTTTCSQDTPEEWVEKLWKLIDAYRDSKDITSELERIEEVNQYVKQLLEELERIEEVNQYVKQLLEELERIEEVNQFVKQLLDDREREAYHDGYTDGVTRCMDSLNKLEEDKNEGA